MPGAEAGLHRRAARAARLPQLRQDGPAIGGESLTQQPKRGSRSNMDLLLNRLANSRRRSRSRLRLYQPQLPLGAADALGGDGGAGGGASAAAAEPGCVPIRVSPAAACCPRLALSLSLARALRQLSSAPGARWFSPPPAVRCAPPTARPPQPDSCPRCTVRRAQKWIEGEFWAEQFASRPLIAFTHVKGGATSERNAMADGLAKKGIAFRTAKHSAIRHGLADTRWAAAAPCFVGNMGMVMAEPDTDPTAAAKAILAVCGTEADKPLLLLGGVYQQQLVSVLDIVRTNPHHFPYKILRCFGLLWPEFWPFFGAGRTLKASSDGGALRCAGGSGERGRSEDVIDTLDEVADGRRDGGAAHGAAGGRAGVAAGAVERYESRGRRGVELMNEQVYHLPRDRVLPDPSLQHTTASFVWAGLFLRHRLAAAAHSGSCPGKPGQNQDKARTKPRGQVRIPAEPQPQAHTTRSCDFTAHLCTGINHEFYK